MIDKEPMIKVSNTGDDYFTVTIPQGYGLASLIFDIERKTPGPANITIWAKNLSFNEFESPITDISFDARSTLDKPYNLVEYGFDFAGLSDAKIFNVRYVLIPLVGEI